ncbi:MAG: NAD-dependent epimerase/dehydratase family protein [Acidobacteria bacterium]|nr:NAD-dependent epimerase/dehydratase family protein [Acidobacteriota bacterium]
MRILILGGTVFLSAEVARQAVERGHDVTCLARGESGEPPAGVTFVRGHRDDGASAYASLGHSEFDAVVDVARDPALVAAALEALAARARHWTFISSVSVYADGDTMHADESAALVSALQPGQATADHYAEAKVSCEQLVRDAVGQRAHISRPGLIVGAGDPSDRMGYWPARFARDNNPVVVPDDAEAMVQFTDVLDYASWLLDAVESQLVGTFNAVGEPTHLTTFLGACVVATDYSGHIIVADSQWLQEQGVRPWSGPQSLPLWTGETGPGFATRSADAALAAGMKLRTFDESLENVLADEQARGLHRERMAGLSAATERALVAAWEATT